MKIKNTYIKKLVKVEVPTDKQLEYAVIIEKQSISMDRLKAAYESLGIVNLEQVTDEHNKQIDIPTLTVFTKEEEQIIREKARIKETKYKAQLLKVTKFPKLYAFLHCNADEIYEMGQNLITSDYTFSSLSAELNIDPTTKAIDIYFDSNTVLCTIRSLSKDELENMLKSDAINIELYEKYLPLFLK